MAAGFSNQGLEIKTIEDIRAGIESDQLATIDPALDVSDDQPLGQMNGIVASRHAEGWELARYVWNSLNPNTARGVALDNIGALIGLPRLSARRSTVVLELQVAAGITVPAGSLVAVNGASSNTWQSTESFTSLFAGPWPVGFESTQDGAITAPVLKITEIVTPIAGWVGVTNREAPLLGHASETDEEYRLRRSLVLARAGQSTVDALRADLLSVKNVVQALVLENDTDAFIGALPPHSLEAIIFDDANQASNSEIAQVLWGGKPGGIQLHGSTTATATDALGNLKTVRFSRGTQKRIRMAISLQVLAGWQESQLEALRTTILSAFRTQRLGEDVLSLKYKSIAIAAQNAYNVSYYVAGVFPQINLDQDIPIGVSEIATLAPGDLTIQVINIGTLP